MSDPSAQQPVAGIDPAKAPIQGGEWRGSNEAIVPAKAGSDIFFAAVKTTRMPMVVTDPHRPDNPIIFCNEAFSFMTGYSQDEILGYNCRFLQGPETDQTAIDEVRAAIAKREEVAVEVLNYRKNGSTFWNALFVSPVFGDDGELRYFFASQLDISRRREAEEALHEAQRMEAVGKLTGGIAHDFNNLLQVIQGYADILDARIGPDDRSARRAVDAISTSAARAATLTQQLLAFARKQELRDRLMNLNQLVGDFRPILERSVGAGITLKRDLASDLWNCRVDPVQTEMALLNIIANARDATGGAGTVTITTRNAVLPEDASVAKLEPGEYVVATIRDDGPGIDPTVAEKIFEPFYTTKEMGKGAGLGLAMVYGFMRQSGGIATVQNVPGGGAAFSLYFPRASGAVERKPTGPVAPHAGGAERVLMVEDQIEVGELGKTILEDLGYEVVLVDSARAALDTLHGDSDFRLLFTDILMPGGMNGVALAQAVRRDYPHTAVLLTTGFADEAIDAGSRSFELIRKPYRRNELNERIRAVLDKPGART
ncbi:PAS domain S-box-containing protein [Sphingomonas aurantiaca]|jgi:PAS domain S-box-containing protein|uniref:histidine kinase n=1 Tax=Sphingomonas aurantiaca TaxID=185949 RepID=A0A2T5GNI3_9SPHN|nr:histidine kinase famiy protein [Sphingomonas aurantiaca]PTQ60905.1 PAS domain S-box-containing protein [Sphingomonas aurantiaca]